MSVTWTVADLRERTKELEEENKLKKIALEIKRLSEQKKRLESLISKNEFDVVAKCQWKTVDAKIKTLTTQLNVMSKASTAKFTANATKDLATTFSKQTREIARAANQMKRIERLEDDVVKFMLASEKVEELQERLNDVTESVSDELEHKIGIAASQNQMPDVAATFVSLPRVPDHE